MCLGHRSDQEHHSLASLKDEALAEAEAFDLHSAWKHVTARSPHVYSFSLLNTGNGLGENNPPKQGFCCCC